MSNILEIKNILDVTKEEAEHLGKIGFTKHSGLHHDICKALAEGKAQQDIAEDLHIYDRHVRAIKKKKCPDCGVSKRGPH
jgi:DNA-binding NarL/FixJ family response regulator